MRGTYTDRRLCIFLMQMLKTVSISFINCELVKTLYSVGCIPICSGSNNTLLLYACEVIYLKSNGVISLYVQE